jgi:hypothetical protein
VIEKRRSGFMAVEELEPKECGCDCLEGGIGIVKVRKAGMQAKDRAPVGFLMPRMGIVRQTVTSLSIRRRRVLPLIRSFSTGI